MAAVTASEISRDKYKGRRFYYMAHWRGRWQLLHAGGYEEESGERWHRQMDDNNTADVFFSFQRMNNKHLLDDFWTDFWMK